MLAVIKHRFSSEISGRTACNTFLFDCNNGVILGDGSKFVSFMYYFGIPV